MEPKEVGVGQHVVFVDSGMDWHQALLTAVWGEPHIYSKGFETGEKCAYPCVNLVYVSGDPSKDDQYGRQIERDGTSVPHFRDSTAPGYVWLHPDEVEEAKAHFAEAKKGLKV